MLDCISLKTDCINGQWTPFYDRDNPGGSGDYETFSHLRARHSRVLCSNPIGIDAQTTGGVNYKETGQVLQVGVTTGLVCRNNEQSNRRCLDYRVRFCCPSECVSI